jgi:hypothetical protein
MPQTATLNVVILSSPLFNRNIEIVISPLRGYGYQKVRILRERECDSTCVAYSEKANESHCQRIEASIHQAIGLMMIGYHFNEEEIGGESCTCPDCEGKEKEKKVEKKAIDVDAVGGGMYR